MRADECYDDDCNYPAVKKARDDQGAWRVDVPWREKMIWSFSKDDRPRFANRSVVRPLWLWLCAKSLYQCLLKKLADGVLEIDQVVVPIRAYKDGLCRCYMLSDRKTVYPIARSADPQEEAEVWYRHGTSIFSTVFEIWGRAKSLAIRISKCTRNDTRDRYCMNMDRIVTNGGVFDQGAER